MDQIITTWPRTFMQKRGLWCIDCHTRKDVMGDGHTYSYEMEVPKRSCADCHGGFNSAPDLTNGAIRKVSGEFLFISKNHGKKHRLPSFFAKFDRSQDPGPWKGTVQRLPCPMVLSGLWYERNA